MKVLFQHITLHQDDPHFYPTTIEVEGGKNIQDNLEEILRQRFCKTYGDIPDGEYVKELIRDTPVVYSEHGLSARILFEEHMYLITVL